jgi:hypothetical protein
MLLLAQNSDGALHEAWGIVFFMGVLATLVSLAVFLATRTRRAGHATGGYAIMTVGIAILLFLDLPVVGMIIALPGLALALYAYTSARSKRAQGNET